MSCCGSCGGQNPEEYPEKSNEETGTDENEQKPAVVTLSDEKQDMYEEK